MHHERRHADRGQHVAHVELADQVHEAPDRGRRGGQPLEPAAPLHEAGIARLARRHAGHDATLAPVLDELGHVLIAHLGGPGELVAGRPGGPREGGIENEGAHAVGVGGGEHGRHRAALERADDRDALRADGIHHGDQIVHLVLERRGAEERVREARAAPVEGDEAREARDPPHHAHERALGPEVLDLRDPGRNPHQVDGSVSLHDVGDVQVAALGVAGHGRHGINLPTPGTLLLRWLNAKRATSSSSASRPRASSTSSGSPERRRSTSTSRSRARRSSSCRSATSRAARTWPTSTAASPATPASASARSARARSTS